MSSRYDHESYHQNQQIARELENPAHSHAVGELHGKQEHLTSAEQTSHDDELAQDLKRQTHGATVGHGITSFGHEDISLLAYELWELRGRPIGSPQVDWFETVKRLRSRGIVA